MRYSFKIPGMLGQGSIQESFVSTLALAGVGFKTLGGYAMGGLGPGGPSGMIGPGGVSGSPLGTGPSSLTRNAAGTATGLSFGVLPAVVNTGAGFVSGVAGATRGAVTAIRGGGGASNDSSQESTQPTPADVSAMSGGGGGQTPYPSSYQPTPADVSAMSGGGDGQTSYPSSYQPTPADVSAMSGGGDGQTPYPSSSGRVTPSMGATSPRDIGRRQDPSIQRPTIAQGEPAPVEGSPESSQALIGQQPSSMFDNFRNSVSGFIQQRRVQPQQGVQQNTTPTSPVLVTEGPDSGGQYTTAQTTPTSPVLVTGEPGTIAESQSQHGAYAGTSQVLPEMTAAQHKAIGSAAISQYGYKTYEQMRREGAQILDGPSGEQIRIGDSEARDLDISDSAFRQNVSREGFNQHFSATRVAAEGQGEYLGRSLTDAEGATQPASEMATEERSRSVESEEKTDTRTKGSGWRTLAEAISSGYQKGTESYRERHGVHLMQGSDGQLREVTADERSALETMGEEEFASSAGRRIEYVGDGRKLRDVHNDRVVNMRPEHIDAQYVLGDQQFSQNLRESARATGNVDEITGNNFISYRDKEGRLGSRVANESEQALIENRGVSMFNRTFEGSHEYLGQGFYVKDEGRVRRATNGETRLLGRFGSNDKGVGQFNSVMRNTDEVSDEQVYRTYDRSAKENLRSAGRLFGRAGRGGGGETAQGLGSGQSRSSDDRPVATTNDPDFRSQRE